MMSENIMGLFDEDLNDIYVRSCQKEVSGDSGKDSGYGQESLDRSQQDLHRLVRDDKNVVKVPCFGGVLFQRDDAYNNRILSFAVEGMTDAEREEMKKQYQTIYRSSLPRLISKAEPFVEIAEPYTVFNFEYDPNNSSLRDYCKNRDFPVERVMRKLVAMLVYRAGQFRILQKSYQSLNCLSLDTLFVDAQGELWLLPLRAFRNRFPREIAPEAYDPLQNCDERSDLFSAAYVAVEVEGKGELPEGKEGMLYVKNVKIRECLLAIPQCRPQLTTIANMLRDRSNCVQEDEGLTGETVSGTGKIGNATREQGVGNKIFEACKAAWKRIREWLSGMFVFESVGEINRTTKGGKLKLHPIEQIDETEEDRL